MLAPHLAASDSRIADLGTIRVKCGVEECDVVLVRLDLGVGELLAHRVDGLLVVRAVEDRRARHEHVHARLRDLLDVGHADAAVNLERDVVARLWEDEGWRGARCERENPWGGVVLAESEEEAEDAKRDPEDAKRDPEDAKRDPDDAKRDPDDARGGGALTSSIILRASRALSRVAGMNFWPPKPGLTDISRMMSILSITYLQMSSDVDGLKTRPDLQPAARTRPSERSM